MADRQALAAALMGRQSNIDDRRSENFSGSYHDDGSFAWDRIPQSAKALGVSMGNALWGTPQIPEAPRSYLSDALGREDMKLEPNVGPSLLHRAIDDVQTGANMFGLGKGPAWADQLTEEHAPLIDILQKFGISAAAAPGLVKQLMDANEQ